MTTTTDLIKANGEGGEAPPAPEGTGTPALTGKRANWTIAHTVDFASMTITWQVKGAGALSLDVSKVNQANRERAMLHGFVQRVSDAAAMSRDTKTGKSATPQEKYEAMQRLVEHYASGAEGWSPVREGSGAGAGRKAAKEHPQAELLRMALLIHSPEKGAETIAKFVSERSAAQITALVLSEQLKAAVELAKEQLREREQKAAEGVNAEELLSGLAGL